MEGERSKNRNEKEKRMKISKCQNRSNYNTVGSQIHKVIFSRIVTTEEAELEPGRTLNEGKIMRLQPGIVSRTRKRSFCSFTRSFLCLLKSPTCHFAMIKKMISHLPFCIVKKIISQLPFRYSVHEVSIIFFFNDYLSKIL